MGHYDKFYEAEDEQDRQYKKALKEGNPRAYYRKSENLCEVIDLVLDLKERIEKLEKNQNAR